MHKCLFLAVVSVALVSVHAEADEPPEGATALEVAAYPAPPSRPPALVFSKMSVFGDSLSDMGNKHEISKGLNQASSGAVGIRAKEPNYQGRFSNGPVWVERLAKDLGGASFGRAHGAIQTTVVIGEADDKQAPRSFSYQADALKGEDWAVGGAMAGTGTFLDLDVTAGLRLQSGLSILPNTGAQIASRKAGMGAFAANELVVYLCGTNNLWFTLFGGLGQTGTKAAELALEDLRQLLANGATALLVANIPDFQNAPWLLAEKTKVTRFISEYNGALKAGVATLRQQSSGVTFFEADFFGLFAEITNAVATKASYQNPELNIRIDDAVKAAYDYGTGVVEPTPDRFLYWDGLHPTAAVHQLMAQRALQAIRR